MQYSLLNLLLFSHIILYVDIILGNEIKFFSRVTCISVRSSYKIKNILNNRSEKENLEYKETEKEENIDEEEKNNENRKKLNGQNQSVESLGPRSQAADLFLVGREDGTLDLFQVKIPAKTSNFTFFYFSVFFL